MKKFLTTVLIGVMLISSLSVSAASFTDVKQGEWYYETVTEMTDMGLFKGKENNLFCPNDTMTRAEASTVLYRIIEKSARASVSFDLQDPITIYEGQQRSNRLAKEGDTFVKADGTQIIPKKGPNGVLGEGQGVAPDVGLVDTVGQGSNVTHPVLKANGRMHTYRYGLDSVDGPTGDTQYQVNPLTGEGHWEKEWSTIPQPKATEENYDTFKVGQVSADKNFVWTGMIWKLVVDAPNLVK